MSWDIEPYDIFKRFFGSGSMTPFGQGREFNDMFREFDNMRREFDRMFEDFADIEKSAPKELVKEYETPNGKVRKVGPLVYGYSMTIGSDGKPHVREFGNVRQSGQVQGRYSTRRPQIFAQRDPLIDVNVTEKEVKAICEMPGVKKEEIKINAYDGAVEVITTDEQRKYHKTIELPPETDIETVRSNYNNGILEITFNKKTKRNLKERILKWINFFR